MVIEGIDLGMGPPLSHLHLEVRQIGVFDLQSDTLPRAIERSHHARCVAIAVDDPIGQQLDQGFLLEWLSRACPPDGDLVLRALNRMMGGHLPDLAGHESLAEGLQFLEEGEGPS